MTPSKTIIPVGFCQCGCGHKTNIATENNKKRGLVKGDPVRYLVGHVGAKMRLESRSLVVEGIDCKTIPLTRDLECVVDAADYNYLMQWRWYAYHHAKNDPFYAVRTDGFNNAIYLHRDLLGLTLGDPRRGDHVSGNTLDNRRVNLRIATPQQNSWNSRMPSTNTSGFKGVSRHRSGWVANISINGKSKFLGRRSTPEEAYKLYCEAAQKHRQEFARV